MKKRKVGDGNITVNYKNFLLFNSKTVIYLYVHMPFVHWDKFQAAKICFWLYSCIEKDLSDIKPWNSSILHLKIFAALKCFSFFSSYMMYWHGSARKTDLKIEKTDLSGFIKFPRTFFCHVPDPATHTAMLLKKIDDCEITEELLQYKD